MTNRNIDDKAGRSLVAAGLACVALLGTACSAGVDGEETAAPVVAAPLEAEQKGTGVQHTLAAYVEALQDGDVNALEATISPELRARIEERGQAADYRGRLAEFAAKEGDKLLGALAEHGNQEACGHLSEHPPALPLLCVSTHSMTPKSSLTGAANV
jgi:hypothetical protein